MFLVYSLYDILKAFSIYLVRHFMNMLPALICHLTIVGKGIRIYIDIRGIFTLN